MRTCALPDWTEYAPLRRNAIRFFDNSVERASRERADSGISPIRSHKIGHCILSGMRVVASTSLSSGWSWQPPFYPSGGN